MSKKKKKLSKGKKKFFIIISCYVAIFLITSIFTSVTLAWFNGSTYQSNILYMGGPVYMYFSDSSGVTPTSGEKKLVTETPEGWDYLYPGMSIYFEAKAVLQGAKWEKPKDNGETQFVYTTGAVLRAQIKLEVIDTEGSNNSLLANEIYNWIWPQLYDKATNDQSNIGYWIMDTLPTSTRQEDNYFYYVNKGQTGLDKIGDYELTEVGGVDYNVSVGLLNEAIITLPGLELTNIHADCDIKFTIIFQAIQAFFPYTSDDLYSDYQGDTTGRDPQVTQDDLGLPKPLTIENSRRMFAEALDYMHNELNKGESN